MIKCLSLGWKVGSDFRGVKLYLVCIALSTLFFKNHSTYTLKRQGEMRIERENRKVNALKKAFFVHYIIYISKGQRPLRMAAALASLLRP